MCSFQGTAVTHLRRFLSTSSSGKHSRSLWGPADGLGACVCVRRGGIIIAVETRSVGEEEEGSLFFECVCVQTGRKAACGPGQEWLNTPN